MKAFFHLSIYTAIAVAFFHQNVSAFTAQPEFSRSTRVEVSKQARNVQLAMVGKSDSKETTWDRITGPKLFKTVTNWSGIHAVPLVPLRVLTGLLMIHHGSEGELDGEAYPVINQRHSSWLNKEPTSLLM